MTRDSLPSCAYAAMNGIDELVFRGNEVGMGGLGMGWRVKASLSSSGTWLQDTAVRDHW